METLTNAFHILSPKERRELSPVLIIALISAVMEMTGILSVMPFLGIVILAMVLMYLFPGIALWLPETLFAN